MSTQAYDPFDVSADVPLDALREMRETCPVAAIDVGWLLTTHADVKSAVRDVESFITSYREPGVVVPDEEQLLPEMPEPRHGKVRRIVNAVVGWHKAVRMEGFIRDLSHEEEVVPDIRIAVECVVSDSWSKDSSPAAIMTSG